MLFMIKNLIDLMLSVFVPQKQKFLACGALPLASMAMLRKWNTDHRVYNCISEHSARWELPTGKLVNKKGAGLVRYFKMHLE